MYILESYPLAVAFCVITMLCWGSWANTQKAASGGWRFELFYWDYAFGVLACSLLLAFTMGSTGASGRPFLADLAQADGANLASALLGGVIFNAANILLVAAIAVSGMAVAFPVGIGLALVIGVIVNYVAAPAGNPWLLFGGTACIAVAIGLDAVAYGRLPGQGRSDIRKGLVLAVLCGVLMGCFYRFVAAAMPEPGAFAQMPAGKLSPYTAMVVFSAGILASSLVFNTLIMRRPISGARVAFADYFQGRFRDHALGWLGGAIWAIGMSFSMIAAGKASFAIAYGLGQGATMVAAFWGVFVWREFKGAPRGTNPLLAWMFAGYLAGLVLIIAAH